MGGALSTGNLGVSALGTASVKGILKVFPQATILFQDWGDQDYVTIRLADRSVTLRTTPLHPGDALRQRAGTRHLSLLAAAHRYLPASINRCFCLANRCFSDLLGVEAALALCGGDSFSDTYGQHVLEAQAAMMLLMAEMGKQLILMPQTLGPFKTREAQHLARHVLERCDLITTRDVNGIEELREVFNGWTPERVAACPDVAFTLDSIPVSPEREPFVLEGTSGLPLIGLNVSGLLYLSERDFGLRHSYPRLIDALAEWACQHRDRRLLLIPHVISYTPPGQDATLSNRSGDVSDTAACRLVQRRLAERFADRIGCLGWPRTAGETKHVIGRCEFMIGARMHACIAGVSQAIPTVTLAYSKKAAGVMGHLGECGPVVDLRDCSVEECVQEIDQWYERRGELRAGLLEVMPRVRARVEHFFAHDLRSTLRSLRPAANPATYQTELT